MSLEKRILDLLRAQLGAEPTKKQLDAALRGYRDQQKRNRALEKSGLNPDEQMSALQSEAEDIINQLDGKPPKQN